MNMTIVSSVVTITVLVIALVVSHVDWRKMATRWVGNNPSRAQIYIKAGDTVRTLEGERIYQGYEGQTYAYKLDKIYQVVGLKRNYPYNYIRGRRIIGLEDGVVVASPLGYMDNEELSKYHEGLTDLSALYQGKVMVEVMQSVKASKAISWIMVIIIGAVVIVGAYFFLQKSGIIPGPVAPVAEQQTTEIPGPVLPKDKVSPSDVVIK